MDMSPLQQQQVEEQEAVEVGLRRGSMQQENNRRMKSHSFRRQSAPSLVITKALTRSKTLSRDSFLVPVSPETCPLVQSFLASSQRCFLLHGRVQLRTGMQTQDRHLFLFNDVLVVAKAKSANHFKLKTQVCVSEMWTASCVDEVCEGSVDTERSFVMGWPTCNCVAVYSSAEQKEKWLSLLKSRIKEEKEREEPKTIPLRVYGKGINSFAVTKTLPVSNSDSTNEVIRLALQQFSIIGNVKNYQLWVISKRDNAPYPLIGHEFPFSVHMNHMRQAASQGGGARDAATAATAEPLVDRDRLQVGHVQASRQCQFILKPRPEETLLQQQQVFADFSQKSFKRRRSLMTWAFWRGSAPHLNELSVSGAARGCLFGRHLSCICVDDALPKPVMDMLVFLYHEGPWTRGIFRRPAGARAVRELRDSLDAGEAELPLTCDHVFVIAGVFKDFLRNIPGSLLCCELHEEWMDVLEEEEEEEEQVQDVQRMICRLPRENTLLLRHLLALLHGIHGNAHDNQMTTFNLSVCIAPSMLWPPGAPCSPEVEGEETKKVCELVKFMIEHCQQILGEDPWSLFGGPPQRRHSDQTGSESWSYPLTDSSYDSLENELDNSSGGSPSLCSHGRLRSQPLQGSLDSILTSSDCDQDTGPDGDHVQTRGLHGLERTRGRKQDSAAAGGSSSTLDSLSPEGPHRPRRRSEPAIAYMAKFGPCASGSTEVLSGEEEEEDAAEDVSKKTLHCIGQSRRAGGEREACSSSFSSTTNSPAPTRSSLDSLDSLSSDRPVLLPAKTLLPSSGSSATTPPPLTSSEKNAGPKSSPPREALSRGTVKSRGGFHPNTWLKKGRRLSLTQQDNAEKEEEEEDEKTAGGVANKCERGGVKQKICRSRKEVKMRLDPEAHRPPSHHRSTGSLHPPAPACSHCSHSETKQPSPSFFSQHRAPSLSLFKRRKSHSVEVEHNARLHARRASEPGQRLAERASDPGLKVSQVDSQVDSQVGSQVGSQGSTADACFCLSPHSTKAVRDYFSSHPRSNPHSSQQVALALVKSHREWLRRCSDPMAEPDYEQLLFAEESFV